MNIKEERIIKHMKFVKEVNKTRLELLTINFRQFNKDFIVEHLSSGLSNFEIIKDVIKNNKIKQVTHKTLDKNK